MATVPDSTIRLLRPWRGRGIGSIIPGLDYGVADLLVSRRWAEWAPGLAAQGTPLGKPPSLTGAPPAQGPQGPSSAPPAGPAAVDKQPAQPQLHKRRR